MTDSKSGLGKEALLVLGMHRSGTSAITGVLSCLGVQLGTRLYAPHAGVNEKGYFEHSDITDTDDEALMTIGSSWDDVLESDEEWWNDPALAPLATRIQHLIRRDFSRAPIWALKDPRLCRLLPWWQRVLADLHVSTRYVIITRHPFEVANSLSRRNGFSTEKSLLLWIEHNLSAERWTRQQRRVFVLYEQLLASFPTELERIQAGLELQFPIPVDQAVHCVGRFLSTELRHHYSLDGFAPSQPLAAIALEVFEIFGAATGDSSLAVPRAALDRLQLELKHYRTTFPAILAEHARTVTTDRARLQLTLDKVQSSWWWTLGKPLRTVERLARRTFQR